MIICLEGPDGAGKSHLAEQLRSMDPKKVSVIHFPTYDFRSQYTSQISYGFANFADMWEVYKRDIEPVRHRKMVILDRFYPSTFIYNFHGIPPVPESSLPPVDLFVNVSTPYDSYPRSKGELTEDEYLDKFVEYKKFFEGSDVPTLTYDPTKDTITCLWQALSIEN